MRPTDRQIEARSVVRGVLEQADNLIQQYVQKNEKREVARGLLLDVAQYLDEAIAPDGFDFERPVITSPSFGRNVEIEYGRGALA